MKIISNFTFRILISKLDGIIWLLAFLLFSSVASLPHSVAYSAELPTKADIAKIYNIEKADHQKIDVRFYRKGECDNKEWCSIRGEGAYLKAKDYLNTGEVSRADLALINSQQQYNEVLFWQQERSLSIFMPQEGTCHFKVDTGGFLYAHPHQSGTPPGCERIVSKNALVMPNGTALFIIGDKEETLVGVLSNKPTGFITVKHLKSKEMAELKAGEYAKALSNGKIIKGNFNLEDFYKSSPLTLGLGPEDRDEKYVEQQEPAIQVILKKLRAETITAMEEQDTSKPTTPIDELTHPRMPPDTGTQSGPPQPDPPKPTLPEPTSPPQSGPTTEPTPPSSTTPPIIFVPIQIPPPAPVVR